jgi:hypothetical protein
MAEMTLEDARVVLSYISPRAVEAAIREFIGADAEKTVSFVCDMYERIVDEGHSEEYATAVTEAFLVVVKQTRAH